MVICNSMTVWAADSWKGNGTYTKGTTGIDDADRDSVDTSVDNPIDTNSGQKDVKGNITLTENGKTYNVTISWGSMEYNATPASGQTLKGTWNAGAYYEVSGFGSWQPASAGANKITITNNSNAAISPWLDGTINCSEGDTLYADYGVTSGSITFGGDGNNKLLDSAASTDANKDVVSEHIVNINAPITKSPNLSITGLVLGTVTVTLDPASWETGGSGD